MLTEALSFWFGLPRRRTLHISPVFEMSPPERPFERPSGAKGNTPIQESNAIAGPSTSLPRHGITPTAEPEIDPELDIFQRFALRTEAGNARIRKLNALCQAKRSNPRNRDSVSDDEDEDDLPDLASFLLHRAPPPLSPSISITSPSAPPGHNLSDAPVAQPPSTSLLVLQTLPSPFLLFLSLLTPLQVPSLADLGAYSDNLLDALDLQKLIALSEQCSTVSRTEFN